MVVALIRRHLFEPNSDEPKMIGPFLRRRGGRFESRNQCRGHWMGLSTWKAYGYGGAKLANVYVMTSKSPAQPAGQVEPAHTVDGPLPAELEPVGKPTIGVIGVQHKSPVIYAARPVEAFGSLKKPQS